jgi:hypothetical protein
MLATERQRLAQRRQLRLASDEDVLRRAFGRRLAPAGGPRARDAQPPQDLGTRGSTFRLGRQQEPGHAIEVFGNAADQRTRRRGRLALSLEHVAKRFSERQLSGQGLEEHDSHAVPVGRLGEPVAGELFGRHVGQRPRKTAGDTPLRLLGEHPGGQSEVEDDHASCPIDQDVGGLDVAVDLPVTVQEVESLGELDQGLSQTIEVPRRSSSRGVQPTAHVLDEARTRHELHREEAVALADEELVQAHEIRMAQLGEGAELPLEPVDLFRAEMSQGLRGHREPESRVMDTVDHPHAALSDAREDAEAAILGERRSGQGERHRRTSRRLGRSPPASGARGRS